MIVKANSTIPLELRVTDMFGQAKTDITSVSVRVYHRVAGNIVEDLVPTAMAGSGSLWYYSYDSTLVEGEYVIEYTIIDDVPDTYIQTELLEVGYLEDDITFIKDIESGKWEIKSNQMIFFKTDGITEVARFNLFDSNGDASMTEVFKRVRV